MRAILLLLMLLSSSALRAADLAESQCPAPVGPSLTLAQQGQIDRWIAALAPLGAAAAGYFGAVDDDLQLETEWTGACAALGFADRAACAESFGADAKSLWAAQAVLAAFGDSHALDWLQRARTRPSMRMLAASLRVALAQETLEPWLREVADWSSDEQGATLLMAPALGLDRSGLRSLAWSKHSADPAVRAQGLSVYSQLGEPDYAGEWALIVGCGDSDCVLPLDLDRGAWTLVRDHWATLGVDARDAALRWSHWTSAAQQWALGALSGFTPSEVAALHRHALAIDQTDYAQHIVALSLANWVRPQEGAWSPPSADLEVELADPELPSVAYLLSQLSKADAQIRATLEPLLAHDSAPIVLAAATTMARLGWADAAANGLSKIVVDDGSLPAWVYDQVDPAALLPFTVLIDHSFASPDAARACRALSALAYQRSEQSRRVFQELLPQATRDLLLSAKSTGWVAASQALFAATTDSDWPTAIDSAAACRVYFALDTLPADDPVVAQAQEMLDGRPDALAVLMRGWIWERGPNPRLREATDALAASGVPELVKQAEIWQERLDWN